MRNIEIYKFAKKLLYLQKIIAKFLWSDVMKREPLEMFY